MRSSFGDRNGWLDRLILMGLLASTFLLPTLFGSISIVVALLLTLVASVRFFLEKDRPSFVLQPTLTALFGALLLLSAVSAISADRLDDMSFIVSFLGLALPLLLYQYLVNLPKPPTFLQIAAYCLLGCTLGLLFAHAQRYGLGIGRTVAVSAGSNAVARVAALLGFLALIGVSTDLKSSRNVVAVALVMALGIVILAGSRGTLLAVALMALVALMFALPQLWAKSKRVAIAVIVFAALAFITLALFDPNGFITRFGHTLSELAVGRLPGHSSELRYEMLVGAWNAFWQSPLIGHGWAGHWTALVQNHPTPEIFAPVKQYFTYHNDIADFAVAGGVLGLIAYAAIISAPVFNLLLDPDLCANPHVAYALILLPVTYLVFGLTDFAFGFDLLTTLYGFSLAFILAAAKASQIES